MAELTEVRLSRILAQALAFVAVGAVVCYFLMAETPRGALEGTVIAEELGRPLPSASVRLGYDDYGMGAFRTRTDDEGRFHFDHVPAGSYQLRVSARAHKQPPQSVTIREGETLKLNLELKPVKSFLELMMPQRVFTPREQPQIRCRGFAPTSLLRADIYRLRPEVARPTRRTNLQRLLVGSPRGRAEDLDLDRSDKLDRLSRRTLPVTGRDAEGVFSQRLDLPRFDPGTYVIAVSLGDVRRVQTFTVTDLALVVKTAPDLTLVYAVDIESGDPRPGTEVSATWDGKPAGSGTTDDSGLLEMPLAHREGSGELLVSGRSGGSWASVHTWHWRSAGEPHKVYCYTDRPAYRPGHTVYYKGIVRKLAGDDYQVPANAPVRVTVRDDRDNLVHSADLHTNEFGSFHGELELSESALPGIYAISTSVAGAPHYSEFVVAEYRKPEWEVEVTTDQDRYVRGDTIEATVTANYYYGSPVADAKVRYTVTRSPYWYWPEEELWGEDYFGWDEYYGDGEVVLRGSSATDSAGRLVISIPTTLEETERPEWYSDTHDYRYRVEAEVTDASRRWVTSAGTALVVQGEFRLEVSATPSVLPPEDTATVTINAVDYDGKPVPGAKGDARLELSDWAGRRERFEREASARWKAGKDGKAEVTFLPKQEGSYRVRVTATDSRGNVIKADDWLWVSARGYFSFGYPYGELDLKADKDLYHEGDTAQILINTELAPATALLTVEGPTIYDSRLIPLKANSTIAHVRIKPEYMPNCWVTVTFVRNKRFIRDSARLVISPERKALQVSITTDKSQYLPGQPAVYKVQTTTPSGKPVRAEVSLAVVDEAVHTIAPDSAGDILKFFYPRRYREVETHFSFPLIYLSGDDKAGTDIATRRRFPDTAFWAPATITDEHGEAAFRFEMPDTLTTWRATVRASTMDTRVGQSASKTICTKPLLVRLEAPRFFTQHDQVRLAAIVHNRTEKAVQVRVGLDAPALELAGKTSASGKVAAGQAKRFEWEVALPQVGDTPVRVWAKAGELEDAMELTLPVLPKGRHRVELRSGAVTAEEIERFQIREDAIPGASSLTIRLTPSLASAMLGSLDYLAEYPWGCVEQTLSSFLPDVIIAQMLDRLGIEEPELRKRLPKMVEAGLLKIYDYQKDDGGWGWWRYDNSDPWMTAYAVFGLHEAERAGFTVNPRVLSAGRARLERALHDHKLSIQNRAYVIYVLGLAGEAQAARDAVPSLTRDLRRVSGDCASWARAVGCLALHELGQEQEARQILAELWTKADKSTSLIHWKTTDRYYGHCSQVETTALALSAACRLTPEDERLAKVVRWLLLNRRGNHWYSTRDTAFVLYALADYLEVTGELDADLMATVKLNGEMIASRHFDRRDTFQPEYEMALGPEKLKSGPLEISIARTGRGRLYYTGELSQYLDVDLKAKTLSGTGIVIERTYHKLQTQLGKDRRLNEQALPEERNRFRSGDLIEVRLKVRSDREYGYIMVEDPIPAGCEVVTRGRIWPWEWDYWWADRVVRDELVGFAITRLPVGARDLTYKLVAQIPGEYCAMPTQVYNMYDPTIRATGTADDIVVAP